MHRGANNEVSKYQPIDLEQLMYENDDIGPN